MPMSRWTKNRTVTTALVVTAAAAITVPTVAAATDGDRTEQARHAIQGGHARNVILLLGDGMGDSEITSARDYLEGAGGRLQMDALPMTGAYTTWSVREDDPTKPDYVTDSAASATAWATGSKTYDGAISVDPFTKESLPTILEKAKESGYGTGSITTARLTDATPASGASHVNDRSCEGPEDVAEVCPAFLKANGGPGSIAEQEVQTGVDILMGGGDDKFSQSIPSGEYQGQTVKEQAAALGYTVITDQAERPALKRGDKLLGLFGEGTLPTRWSGPDASPYVMGSNSNNPVDCVVPNPEVPDSQPTLKRMAEASIKLLDAQQEGQEKGFFLQIEGASIDKQDHEANPCGQIGETEDFDDSVGIARAYAADHPDTLVIVTADHGHTSQITYDEQTDADHSPGSIATLTTREGEPLTMNYATNLPGQSQTHSGTQVRIAAQGPQAANVLGITDQTELFTTMSRALRLDGDGHDQK